MVILSNISDKSADRIVTADAVKIGGGMGNIARSERKKRCLYRPFLLPDNSIAALNNGSEEAGDEEEEDDDESSENDDTENLSEEEELPIVATPNGYSAEFFNVRSSAIS